MMTDQNSHWETKNGAAQSGGLPNLNDLIKNDFYNRYEFLNKIPKLGILCPTSEIGCFI